jgi:hypothetical protein
MVGARQSCKSDGSRYLISDYDCLSGTTSSRPTTTASSDKNFAKISSDSEEEEKRHAKFKKIYSSLESSTKKNLLL